MYYGKASSNLCSVIIRLKTWYQACRSRDAIQCENVIVKASEMKDFLVLTQTSNRWAISLIADSKMRTALRDASANDSQTNFFCENEVEINHSIHNTPNEQPMKFRNTSRTNHVPTMSATKTDVNIRDVVQNHVSIAAREDISARNEDEDDRTNEHHHDSEPGGEQLARSASEENRGRRSTTRALIPRATPLNSNLSQPRVIRNGLPANAICKRRVRSGISHPRRSSNNS